MQEMFSIPAMSSTLVRAPAVAVMMVATARAMVVMMMTSARRSVVMVVMSRWGVVAAPSGEARWRAGQRRAEQQQHHAGRTKEAYHAQR